MNTDIKIIKEFSLPLIRVFGSRACFTRPELKVERVSYEVPTPSALEGLLKAIYWHPGINYRINKIHVLNEIEFESRKCNEITTALNAQTFRKNLEKGLPLPHANCSEHDIRNTAHLINVDYIIEANMVIDELIETKENLIKNLAIFQRRLEKGQYFSKPYLGLREFGAYVEKGNKKDIESGYYYNTEKFKR